MARASKVETVTTSLELDEQVRLHELGWRVQQIGLSLLLLFVLIAAAGAFGDGLLSKREFKQGVIRVTAERFYRFEARMPLTIDLLQTVGEPALIRLPISYLQSFQVEAIVPQPAAYHVRDGYITYEFDGSGLMHIRFQLIPNEVGEQVANVDVNGERFEVRHFIYPYMNPVVRGIAVYLFVFIIFRILGKRNLAEVTTFDLVLLLIISETTTDALIAEDYSLTACFIMVCTLVGVDFLLSKLKESSRWFQTVADGAPLVIVDHGRPLKQRMVNSKVDDEDVLEAARVHHGLEKMDDIKYAVLEKDGNISIIPAKKKSI